MLYKDCDYAGADGIAIDTDGTFIVANSFPKSRIDRVTISGNKATWKTIGTGKPPYDRPGSVVIDGTGAAKKLWFTNTSFDVDVDAAAPGLGSAPLK